MYVYIFIYLYIYTRNNVCIDVIHYQEIYRYVYRYRYVLYIYIYIYLSKLKSGERLTPPKANVCGEHVSGAMRACGARVRSAIYARSDACSARYTRAMIVATPCWNIYAVYTSALGLLKPQHSISMVSFTDKLERMRLRL